MVKVSHISLEKTWGEEDDFPCVDGLFIYQLTKQILSILFSCFNLNELNIATIRLF